MVSILFYYFSLHHNKVYILILCHNFMISILVYTSGKSNDILKTLTSIQNQDYKDYELIILADGCSTSVLRELKPYASKLLAFANFKGPSVVKNEGAKRAKNEILLFIDAGTELTPGVINKILETKDDWVVGTCEVTTPEDEDHQEKIYKFINKRLLKRGFDNGLVFCKKTTFEVLGQFDVDLISQENKELINRFKKKGNFKILDLPVVVSVSDLDIKKGIDKYIHVIKQSMSKPINKILE
jgi:glycosyltransferase involved in cell wall biosynthesis